MAAPARAKAKPQAKKRILVVDDDRPTRHLISQLLKNKGYSTAAAAGAKEARALMKKSKFDLMILDVWMPEMTGLELLAQLRAEGHAPPAIVMTADDTPQTVLTAVREQAYLYLAKPVDPVHLQDLVQTALETSVVRPIEVLSARPDWVELLVPCDRQTADRIQSFMEGLRAGLPEKMRAQVGQAFHELLLNAMEWGGQLDPTRMVRIAYVRTERLLMYRIADPGKGFRFEGLAHSAVKNPADHPFQHVEIREKKGIRPGGFGILMTKAIADELVYNEAQNEVLFVKYLTPTG